MKTHVEGTSWREPSYPSYDVQVIDRHDMGAKRRQAAFMAFKDGR
jgi:hypothetical protein